MPINHIDNHAGQNIFFITAKEYINKYVQYQYVQRTKL